MVIPFEELISSCITCVHLLKSILEIICTSHRASLLPKSILSILFDPHAFFIVKENQQSDNEFQKEFEQRNEFLFESIVNERVTIIKLQYNKIKQEIENSVIALRSSFTLLLSIIWRAKLYSSSSIVITHPDQLFILIITRNLIERITEIFYSIHLSHRIYVFLSKTKRNTQNRSEETEINDFTNDSGDLYKEESEDIKKILPEGVYTLNSLVIALTGEKSL